MVMRLSRPVARALQPRHPVSGRVRALIWASIAMMAHVVSEGRLFELTPSDWSVLLGGLSLSGLLILLF